MKSYFLGANTKNGFYSLYAGFPPGPKDYLRILKGGPGTGKSTLLKAIAAAAEQRGLPVERVLCSGDPNSLDGVYLPTVALALADGTAPHAMEPVLFGVTGDYLDLGRAFVLPFTEKEKQTLLALQKEHREQYRLAYELLAQAASLGWNTPAPVPEWSMEAVISALPDREGSGTIRRVFRSAISCEGLLSADLPPEYQILPASPEKIIIAASTLSLRGWSVTLYPSPLDPSQPELLLLPEASLGFLAATQPSLPSREPMQQAISRLRKAKALHDEMEAFYRPHMDVSVLTEEAQRQIKLIFPE